MKKAVIFFVLVLIVIGSCAAQNSNVAEKIVGTWTDNGGGTWVFSANGKLTISNHEAKYYIIDTKLAITKGRNEFGVWDIIISSDGSALFLILSGEGKNTMDLRDKMDQSFWLTKQ